MKVFGTTRSSVRAKSFDQFAPASESTLRLTARTWETWANKDPYYSILSEHKAIRGRWNLDEFFATGRKEIDLVFAHCGEIGIELPTGGAALDFGCGVGRLSRALAERFDSVIGIDIAPRMIELAREHNPGSEFRFLLNQSNDLGILADESIDFIYSAIVLQHIPPAAVKQYVEEFLRVLRVGGIMSIHMPSSAQKPGRGPKAFIRRIVGTRNYDRLWAIAHRTTAIVEMNFIAESEMLALFQKLGATVLRAEPIMPSPIREHRRYIVRK
jgi:2-polyprenyl-3-methyl-5-hydroxy-6-metoxy-1,4-benzoquinol methylase